MKEVKELLLVLEKNAESYEKLAETGKQERELLERGELEGLNLLTMQREELSFRIKGLDAKREALLGKLYENKEIPTLKELAEEPLFLPYRNRILVLRARLKGALDKASGITSYNRALLNKGIETLRGAIEAAAEIPKECATYSSGSMLTSGSSARGGVLSKAL